MKKQEVKEFLEITEALFTIIISIMALWGAISALNSDFMHKVKKIVDHKHKEIVSIENNKPNCSNINNNLQK